MPRGIAWDELPRPYYHKRIDIETSNVDDIQKMKIEKSEPDIYKNLQDIGKRIAFGVVCGSMIGASFGAVDVLRDTKLIVAKKRVAIEKVLKCSGVFAAYFGAYHGTRKTMKLIVPISNELNLIWSGVICITPMLFYRQFRPLVPYAVLLVAIDAINGLNDI